MPRMDRTGPAGRGAMTGRGLGDCNKVNTDGVFGKSIRRGMGLGSGRGIGNGRDNRSFSRCRKGFGRFI